MSAKMKPRDEKKKKKEKKQDGSKFHSPKYIKVTPVSIASKRRNRNCSFLQLRVGLWRGFSGETRWEGEHCKLCRVTYRKNDNEKHLVNHHPFWIHDSKVKIRLWQKVKLKGDFWEFQRSRFRTSKAPRFVWSSCDTVSLLLPVWCNTVVTCDFIVHLLRSHHLLFFFSWWM